MFLTLATNSVIHSGCLFELRTNQKFPSEVFALMSNVALFLQTSVQKFPTGGGLIYKQLFFYFTK